MPDDVLAAVDRVVVRFAGDEAAALAEVTARIGAGRITGLVGPDDHQGADSIYVQIVENGAWKKLYEE